MSASLGEAKNGERKSSERLKLFLLSCLYFLIIAGYTVLRDIKNTIFMSTVGADYIPYASFGAFLFLIPAILFYSKLVDRVRRHQLLMIYSVFFAIFAFIVGMFFIAHPTIGLPNTQQSPYRLFGWLFYFVVEGFTPFVISVLWSFINSVSNPKEARRSYGLLVGGSKIGGIVSAGFSWVLFGSTLLPFVGGLSGVVKHQVAMFMSAGFLILIPFVVRYLMKHVAGYHMHGYEAVYKVEKTRSKEGKAKTGIWAGLKMLIRYPYVLGIFGMVYFYEILAKVLSYLRLLVAKSGTSSAAEISSFLFKWVFIMQIVGLVISVFGTTAIMKRFSQRFSLLLIPVFMAIGSFLFFIGGDYKSITMIGYVMTKTMHDAFSYPVREQLYIPTLKEIKFKSKSWIDAFGQKFSKLNGGVVNMIAIKLGPLGFPFLSGFFVVCIGLWMVVAFMLGIRYERAIDNNEVIGLNGEGDEDDEQGAEKVAS